MTAKKRVRPALDLAVLLDSWILALRSERKSEKTVKVYGEGVRMFLRWCERTDTPPELTKPIVQGFVVALLDEGAEAATARSRQLSLKRFSAWLTAEGELEANEIGELKPPKIDVKVADPLPTLPAVSVAVADSACAPAPNVHASPVTFAHVFDATPDRLSTAVQVIATGANSE